MVDPGTVLVDEPDNLGGKLPGQIRDQGGPVLLQILGGKVGLVDQPGHGDPHRALVEPRVLLELSNAALEVAQRNLHLRHDLVHALEPEGLQLDLRGNIPAVAVEAEELVELPQLGDEAAQVDVRDLILQQRGELKQDISILEIVIQISF